MDKSCKIRKALAFAILLAAIVMMIIAFATPVKAATPRAKFYDFSDQLIDGEIRKPTALYTDSRQEVKFKRLLRLKRAFKWDLMNTAKEKVFK